MGTSQSVAAANAEGLAALKRGDLTAARALFEQGVAAGGASPALWLNLAIACHGLKDDAGLDRALQAALAAEPGNLRALLMKGDVLAARGDRRGALAHYNLAIGKAQDGRAVPPPLAAEIQRARAAAARLTHEIGAHLIAEVRDAGYDAASASPRFTQGLDMLLGTRRRYEQEPRSFFLPELPTVQFYDRAQFPWLAAVEAATDAIRAELLPLLDDPAAWAPYLEIDAARPQDRSKPLLGSSDWSACYIFRNGALVPDIAARCPRTVAAMEGVPLEQVKGRAPFVLFSKLAPHTWIRPHTGYFNTRLVCHLPLVIPPKCTIRVGNETRGWELGKALVFNDSIDHEARNDSGETRVVLIFNIWRPELDAEERRLVSRLLESIDTLDA
jgi:aspartyl/asparaginyl beta-hydroxylase (cupin superfamily)